MLLRRFYIQENGKGIILILATQENFANQAVQLQSQRQRKIDNSTLKFCHFLKSDHENPRLSLQHPTRTKIASDVERHGWIEQNKLALRCLLILFVGFSPKHRRLFDVPLLKAL